VGTVRSNLAGTEFSILDNGVSPAFFTTPKTFPAHVQRELATVVYRTNILGTVRHFSPTVWHLKCLIDLVCVQVPREFSVVLRNHKITHEMDEKSASTPEAVWSSLEQSSLPETTVELHNREPTWNDGMNIFSLMLS